MLEGRHVLYTFVEERVPVGRVGAALDGILLALNFAMRVAAAQLGQTVALTGSEIHHIGGWKVQ